MKKFFLSLIIVAFSTFAFPQWIPQASGTNSILSSVFFLDSINGFVVGAEGIILSTTNGGVNWKNSGTGEPAPYHLSSVYFTDKNIGHVVGSYYAGMQGIYLKTTNGGNTWIETILPEIGSLSSVFFTDFLYGYAVGGLGFMKTTNSGNSWNYQPSISAHNLTSVFFINRTVGYIAGLEGCIMKTTNGGDNWTFQQSGTSRHINEIFFIDSNNGFAVGEKGTILNTTNGGINWITQKSSTIERLSSVFFNDINTGYVVGGIFDMLHNIYSIIILKTTDGGNNWTIQLYIPYASSPLYSVFFRYCNIGYAVGQNGLILKTTNGGNGFVDDNQIPLSGYLLSPNPAYNKIKITKKSDLYQETYVSILNMQGKLLLSSSFALQNSLEMNVSSLASGVYIIKIQAGDLVETKKLVIQ